MLVVRLKKGWTLKLDRKVNDANRAGVWSFHCSESTFVPGMDNLLRHAAIRPAEPAEGKSTEVEVAICRPGDPEEKWIPVGKGVAVYEAERQPFFGLLMRNLHTQRAAFLADELAGTASNTLRYDHRLSGSNARHVRVEFWKPLPSSPVLMGVFAHCFVYCCIIGVCCARSVFGLFINGLRRAVRARVLEY